MSNRDRIRRLLKGIETGDPTAVEVVNEAKYIQHNPQTEEGSEGLADLYRGEPQLTADQGLGDGIGAYVQRALGK